jgi:hypothetical protein
MANNWRPSWKAEVGVNYVPAYEPSGIPFLSGGINCASAAVKVEFPYVTRWIRVVNRSAYARLYVGFSENGVMGSNYFRIMPHNVGATTPGRQSIEDKMELKVSEIWLYNSEDCDIMAGLTTISTTKVSGSKGPSWSGSAGVG